MKVGSLVELVKDFTGSALDFIKEKNIKIPVRNKVYTVRGFLETNNLPSSIYLEEIINDEVFINGINYHEPAFVISFFRELQPPMQIDLEEILSVEA